MLGLLSKTWRPIAILLVALAFFLGAFFFYRGDYEAPPTPAVPFEQIGVPSSPLSSFSETPLVQQGVLLFDGMHRNDFEKGEISTLLSRVTDRGYDIEFLGETSGFGSFRFSSLSLGERLFLLDEKLRQADSFAVILAGDPYDRAEVDIVQRFVEKGGKLLLIADPARGHEMNSLSERFGITFQPDYLYNQVEHDLNFQNIFVRDFTGDEITTGLREIVLYTAGSIKSSGTRLAHTDENTRSIIVERTEPFYPMVKAGDGLVLAISDLTFMIPPQNEILDNDVLVSNIANFLTESRREFELADFPHFFKGAVDILLGRATLFDVGTDLRGMLSGFQTVSELRGIEDLTRDTVYLGLYEDSLGVAQYLQFAGIQVDESLRTPFTPDISTGEAAIILLHRSATRHVLIVLGNSERVLDDMVRRLGSGQFRSGLVAELLGVYRSS